MIDFRASKNAIVKGAINKSNGHKRTLRKIAIDERAIFKFLEIDIFFTIGDVIELDFKEIIGH